MKRPIVLFSALFVFLIANDAFARMARISQIPNGFTYDCATCHVNNSGQSGLNDFGNEILTDFLEGNGQDRLKTVDWGLPLASLDSDGDGYSNGLELNDEDGDETPEGNAFSNPGNANSTPCGNRTLEGPEVCDGTELNGETCVSLGEDIGQLACATDCTFDVTGCDGNMGTNNGTNNATNNGTGGSNNATNNTTNNSTTGLNNSTAGSNNTTIGANNGTTGNNGDTVGDDGTTGENNSTNNTAVSGGSDDGCSTTTTPAERLPVLLLFGLFLFGMRRQRT